MYCTEGIDTLADGKLKNCWPQQYVKYYGEDYSSVKVTERCAKRLNSAQEYSSLEDCNKVYGKYLKNHLDKLFKSIQIKDK